MPIKNSFLFKDRKMEGLKGARTSEEVWAAESGSRNEFLNTKALLLSFFPCLLKPDTSSPINICCYYSLVRIMYGKQSMSNQPFPLLLMPFQPLGGSYYSSAFSESFLVHLNDFLPPDFKSQALLSSHTVPLFQRQREVACASTPRPHQAVMRPRARHWPVGALPAKLCLSTLAYCHTWLCPNCFEAICCNALKPWCRGAQLKLSSWGSLSWSADECLRRSTQLLLHQSGLLSSIPRSTTVTSTPLLFPWLHLTAHSCILLAARVSTCIFLGICPEFLQHWRTCSQSRCTSPHSVFLALCLKNNCSLLFLLQRLMKVLNKGVGHNL